MHTNRIGGMLRTLSALFFSQRFLCCWDTVAGNLGLSFWDHLCHPDSWNLYKKKKSCHVLNGAMDSSLIDTEVSVMGKSFKYKFYGTAVLGHIYVRFLIHPVYYLCISTIKSAYYAPFVLTFFVCGIAGVTNEVIEKRSIFVISGPDLVYNFTTIPFNVLVLPVKKYLK